MQKQQQYSGSNAQELLPSFIQSNRFISKPMTFRDCLMNGLPTENINNMERIVKSLSIKKIHNYPSRKKLKDSSISINQKKSIDIPNSQCYGKMLPPNSEYYGISFMQQQNSIKSSIFRHQQVKSKSKSQSGYRYQQIISPQGELINFKKFKLYLEQYQNNRIKKKMLRNRDLLYSDNYVQIGFTSQLSKQQANTLLIILYFTSQFQLLQNVAFSVKQSDELKVYVYPDLVKKVFAKNQIKIFVKVKLNKWPFLNPFIRISYKTQAYQRNIEEMLPCNFFKFCEIKGKLQSMIYKFLKTEQTIRGPQVPYSLRILSQPQKIRQYFPSFYLVHQNYQQKIFGAQVYFIPAHESYFIQIIIKKNNFLYIQGTAKQKTQSIALENLILDLTGLLMKNIEL